ncbi:MULTISPECIES: hypothetical protein [Halorussus]|uniref:hypothetical protein n=1 Tax=Halorussus TaxID=1070314 RepID=UPI0020A10104|nr:hypothetical protein [Halorussus vallis]USZ75952.1 hypothetical protein NGM07_01195 [Halorussus vallis]
MADRGRADPVSVESEVDPPTGTEYLPRDHAVRYVAVRAAGDSDPPERESAYDTVAFEDWARGKCGKAATRRVREVLGERLGEEHTPGTAWSRRDDGFAVEVSLTTTYDRDGNRLSEPTVEYEEVLDAAPSEVTATVRYAGQEHSETFPVCVDTRESHLL